MSRGSVVAFVLVGLAACLACARPETADFVGVWTSIDDSFSFEFLADGTCIYRMGHYIKYVPHAVTGSYERLGTDALRIHLDHSAAGDYRYIIRGDVLQLTDDRGQRIVYRRLDEPAESYTFGFVPARSIV